MSIKNNMTSKTLIQYKQQKEHQAILDSFPKQIGLAMILALLMVIINI